MDLTSLPSPVVVEPSPPFVAPPPVLVVAPPNPEAPPPVPQEDFLQRISNALAKVGLDPTTLKDHLLAKLEAAAGAYETAQISTDKDFWHNEAVRITAALHAL